MLSSHSGKAVLLVQEVIALANQVNQAYPSLKEFNIQSVSTNDMTYLAEQMLGKQAEFAEKNHPTHVDVGYHYTGIDNLPKIKTHGLMSKGVYGTMRRMV